jgi:Ca2+-binding EF-hand superfamily protein
MEQTVWMGGIPKHCVHGDVGASDQNSLCDPLAAQLEEYTQAGEIMSTTVRVKDGENKSWCLITFSHAQDAEACVAGGCKVQALDGRRWLSLKVKLQDVKGEIVKASTGALAQMATVQQKKVQQTAKKMQKVSAASGSTRFDVQHAHALLFGGKSEEESHQASKFNSLAFEELDDRADGIQMLKRKLRAAERKLPRKAGSSGWRELFDAYDVDGSGELDQTELQRAIRRDLCIPQHDLSDLDLARLFVQIDRDKSGTISADELVEFMRWEPTKKRRSGHALALQAGDEMGAKLSDTGDIVMFVAEYIVLKRAVLREKAEPDSKRLGMLRVGEIVAVTRKHGNRMRCFRLGSHGSPLAGWCSEYADRGAGEPLLEMLPRSEWGSTSDNDHVRHTYIHSHALLLISAPAGVL